MCFTRITCYIDIFSTVKKSNTEREAYVFAVISDCARLDNIIIIVVLSGGEENIEK